jgi:hypothetical protein
MADEQAVERKETIDDEVLDALAKLRASYWAAETMIVSPNQENWLKRSFARNDADIGAMNLIDVLGGKTLFMVALADFLIKKKVIVLPEQETPRDETDFIDQLEERIV